MQYYESRLPLVVLQFLLREIEVTRGTYLATMAVVVEGAFPKSLKGSVTERFSECRSSVARYINRVLGL